MSPRAANITASITRTGRIATAHHEPTKPNKLKTISINVELISARLAHQRRSPSTMSPTVSGAISMDS